MGAGGGGEGGGGNGGGGEGARRTALALVSFFVSTPATIAIVIWLVSDGAANLGKTLWMSEGLLLSKAATLLRKFWDASFFGFS